jgi:hypothetical protein
MGQMTDRVIVSRWLAGYEAAWRAPGTEGLTGIFTDDATYSHSPYEEPVVGRIRVRRGCRPEPVGLAALRIRQSRHPR